MAMVLVRSSKATVVWLKNNIGHSGKLAFKFARFVYYWSIIFQFSADSQPKSTGLV